NSESRTQNPEPKQAKQDKASHCARCSEWIDLMDQTFERARAFRKAIAFWGVSVRGLLARAGTWLDDKALLEAVEEAIEANYGRDELAEGFMRGTGLRFTPPRHRSHARFDEFWEAYPPREGMPAQEQFLHAVRTGTDPQTIIDGAKKYAAVVKGINPKFVPMAHRWLGERRWEDRMEPRRSYRCV